MRSNLFVPFLRLSYVSPIVERDFEQLNKTNTKNQAIINRYLDKNSNE